ncbi:MAG TPA: hypothetical protein VLC28_04150, partial [Flavitalea sp.]|nr:hypothetical protein [Flavitalea sp.]
MFQRPLIRSILFLLIFISLPVLALSADSDTINMKDFGLIPNSRKNAVKLVQLALDSCRKLKRPVMVFKKGRYDFWPQYATEKMYFESNTTANNPKRCAILLSDFNGLTIDANGSDFIFHDRIQPFTIDHSTGIAIKNLQVDWEIPLTAQASVTDTGSNYIDISIDSVQFPFLVEQNKLVFVGEGWKSAVWGLMEFNPASGLIVPGTGDAGVLGNGWESYIAVDKGKGIVRMQYPFLRKPSIGSVLVLRHNERDHAGIFITGSNNVDLDSITIYHTAGLGVLSQYSGDLHFRSVHVVPNTAKNRFFSGHDDGCHFSNCKGNILLEHCSFRGLMDDPVNVHGTAVQVVEKKSDKELLCRFMHHQSTGMEWAFTGDSISFIDHNSMQSIGLGKVARFNALTETDFLLTFEDKVPANFQVHDALENITWTPSITIRNSLFAVNRARGILVSTPGKVLIEGNTFQSSGSAILIAGDANQWFES